MKDLEFINNEKIELAYDIGAGAMAIIAVLVVMLGFSDSLSANEMRIVNIADVCIYIIFVLDYFIRLFTCKNKKIFFKYNIIDLIAIVPLGFGQTTAFSAFKLIKVVAYILRLLVNIKEILFTNGFIYALGSTFVITIISSIGIYIFEYGSEGINNYGDALWWSFVTVTTVGYGDISPTTNGGRFIACILMITGIGFLSMLTSTISTFFFQTIENKKKKEKIIYNEEVIDKLDISDLPLEKRQSLISYYEYLKDN
ncbi:MAG: potassium channel family protein [Clostridium butyricum]|nr:potassium channel family protein [Clostridium butyricum]